MIDAGFEELTTLVQRPDRRKRSNKTDKDSQLKTFHVVVRLQEIPEAAVAGTVDQAKITVAN